ncbi:DUF1836 domain-containing protein [Streptococcus ruminantium]|uniref:DUF1836 domain-containing protein n=1 Tax=Streptococcus ruminantium TaxID=1917441 RepID=UPI0012DCC286|nr:DUF1836 domain-containing protein [Streptococcus ruminantium]
MYHSLPYWHELPDLDLYLDQVLMYVNQATKAPYCLEQKALTAAMINNYVKHKQIEKPIKKKYKKHQLARLIALTILKNVFSIQEISQTLKMLLLSSDSATLYNHFIDCMQDKDSKETPDIIRHACQTVKLYYQTHQLAFELERSFHEE